MGGARAALTELILSMGETQVVSTVLGMQLYLDTRLLLIP